MSYLNGLEDYSERYKAYGNAILNNARRALNKAGINELPQLQEKKKNPESCVINTKNSDIKVENKKNKNIEWVRDALQTSADSSSIFSSIKSNSVNALGIKALSSQNANTQPSNNNSEGSDSEDNYYTVIDVKNTEDAVTNVETVSNATSDEGNGETLLRLFEGGIKDNGFVSNNYIGTNYERNISTDLSKQNLNIYSDNLYNKNNTSIIFGGTANISYNQSNSYNNEKADLNAYTYGKHKISRMTYGAGAMYSKNDGTNNINISIGAMDNVTGIYGIVIKDITKIPGLPMRSNTNINLGIGKTSGYLNPDEYEKRYKEEEISDIDQIAQEVESKESDVSKNNYDDSKKHNNTTVNLVFNKTNVFSEWGVKAGKVYRYTTKNNNNYFVNPYAQITNTSTDSSDPTESTKEGANFILGTNIGQRADLKNGWEITTKGIVEVSRNVVTGSRPSDYILANIGFKAKNKNFSSELSLGGFITNTDTYCKYIEAKIKYSIKEWLSLGLKGGYADYKFDKDKNKLYQIAGTLAFAF